MDQNRFIKAPPHMRRRFTDVYDTKHLARKLPEVFGNSTSLGEVYQGLVGGGCHDQVGDFSPEIAQSPATPRVVF